MKTLTLFPLLILITIFIFVGCADDDEMPAPQTAITTPAELTSALTDIYNDTNAPGFAISIVKNNVLLYQQAFGHADIENNRAYTNQTTQPIGSISKTFVAAAIVKAIEQGYFTLDTNINDILPEAIINPKQPNAVIQVRHLVTHTSGLLDNNEVYLQAYHILPGEDMSSSGAQLLQDAFGSQQRETFPLEDFLAAYYLPEGDLYSMDNFAATAPGNSWNYSNIATSLAAYLVETATETPFRDYVSSNILEPLGMSQTTYDVTELDPTQTAQLYWDKNTPLPNYFNESYPDGSLMTNNEALALFLMDMMKGVRGQSTTLFSTASYELLFDALLNDGQVPTGFANNQGVFWFLDDNTIKHDGSDPGTTCNLEFDANGETGFLLLTNMDASTDAHTNAYFDLAQRVESAIEQFLQAN